MQLKKSWFTHINFSIGTLIMSVYLYTLFVSLIEGIEKSYGVSIKVFGIPVRMVGGILLFLLAIIFFILISFIKSHFISTKVIFKTGINNLIFWLSAILLFAFNFYKRLILLLDFRGVYSNWNFEKWDAILSNFNGSLMPFESYVEKFYVLSINFLLKVFGPLEKVALYLNLFFALGSLVFLFFAVKYVFGRIPAIFALLIISFSSGVTDYLYDLSGINLWLFFISFVVFVIAYFFDLFVEKHPVLYILLFTIVLGALIALGHFVFIKTDFYFYRYNDIFSFMLTDYNWISLTLCIFAFFGLLSYVKAKKDNVFYAIIVFVIFLFMYLFDFSDNPNYLFLTVSVGILAGIGYRWLLFEGLKEYVFSVEDKKPAANDYLKNQDNGIEKSVTEIHAEKTIEVDVNKNDELIISEDDYDDTKDKPKPLHNPLPVPKKHVKKTMDYAFVPKEDMMDFDIEVSENDDFDIN